ncbi:transcription factor E2F6-like isoform X3 [Narcine bancroftii]|uniref:transcription factor E2F6-like isoform X3 n=1 Tax=Narcine bancroftii TaxID=1343680 RepID=UPI0038316229
MMAAPTYCSPRPETKIGTEGSVVPRKGQRKPRFDVSLVRLTQQFMEFVRKAPDGVLDINDVARVFGVRKRRVYDITSVLDGIHLVRKKSKNLIEWIGKSPQDKQGYEAQSQKLRKELADLTTEEDSLDELIKDCAHQLNNLTEDKENARLAYVTYKDIHSLQAFKEQIVIAIKAPQETKLEVPVPKELNLPTLEDVDIQELEAPFTDSEIKMAMMEMPNGKSPGDDGFSVEFFTMTSL